MEELKRFLLEYLPAHVRLELVQGEASAPSGQAQFDEPSPGEFFDKPVLPVEFAGLPPDILKRKP